MLINLKSPLKEVNFHDMIYNILQLDLQQDKYLWRISHCSVMFKLVLKKKIQSLMSILLCTSV